MDNAASEQAESYSQSLIRERIEQIYARRLYLLRCDVASLRVYVAERAPEIMRSIQSLSVTMHDDNEAAGCPEGKALLKELATLEKTLAKLTE